MLVDVTGWEEISEVCYTVIWKNWQDAKQLFLGLVRVFGWTPSLSIYPRWRLLEGFEIFG